MRFTFKCGPAGNAAKGTVLLGQREDCINRNWVLIFFSCPTLKLFSSALERNRRKCLCAGT
uniref:Uncharacterized protein n=1 Tax=Athene cunicularia TaxID=194338 RepID=A0A663LXQ5_ATHCN